MTLFLPTSTNLDMDAGGFIYATVMDDVVDDDANPKDDKVQAECKGEDLLIKEGFTVSSEMSVRHPGLRPTGSVGLDRRCCSLLRHLQRVDAQEPNIHIRQHRQAVAHVWI